MKMKRLLFVFLSLAILVTTACGANRIKFERTKQGGVVVPAPSAQVYKTPEALVIPPTHYPDSTLGKIENDTQNIFIKIWIDPESVEKMVFDTTQIEDILGKPNLILPPGVNHNNMAVDFGFHLILAEGMMKTNYFGWKSLGLAKKEFTVDSRISGGYYGWQVRFHQGDFRR